MKNLKNVIIYSQVGNEEDKALLVDFQGETSLSDVIDEMSYDAQDMENGFYIIELYLNNGQKKELTIKCQDTYLVHDINIDIHYLINKAFLKTYGFNYGVFEKYRDNYSVDAEEAIENLYYDTCDRVREEEETKITNLISDLIK